jgi:hypothetical protein
MGAYEIGLGDLRASVGDVVTITPARFRNDLEATRSYIDGLARDIAAASANPRMTATWKQGWSDFLVRWGTFYADMEGSVNAWLASAFPNLTGSWNSIIRFSEEAQDWARAFRGIGGQRTVVPETMPRPPAPVEWNPLRASASPFTWALLGVAGLFAVVALKRS